MDTLDDDAMVLVLSQVTVMSQWQPVYTNADAAQDRDIHRVHRRTHRQTRAAPSCCHPRPDLTLVCRRFLSVLRSDAAERLWEQPLARLLLLFQCPTPWRDPRTMDRLATLSQLEEEEEELARLASDEAWRDPRLESSAWQARGKRARFAALDWHVTRVHRRLTLSCREGAASARWMLAAKVEDTEAQGGLEWEHGDDVEGVLTPALVAAAFVEARSSMLKVEDLVPSWHRCAQLLRLLEPRLVAPGGSRHSGREAQPVGTHSPWVHIGYTATALGARASRLQSREFYRRCAMQALFALFQRNGSADADVARVLAGGEGGEAGEGGQGGQGGEGGWAGGVCGSWRAARGTLAHLSMVPRLPPGVWTHLMVSLGYLLPLSITLSPSPSPSPNPNPNPNQVSLGYRRTLCRDNSTRRRCYRWLREDVGEAPARHTKSGNSRGIPSDEVCGWSSA